MDDAPSTTPEAVRDFEEAHGSHNVRVILPPDSEWLTYTCHDCGESLRIAFHRFAEM